MHVCIFYALICVTHILTVAVKCGLTNRVTVFLALTNTPWACFPSAFYMLLAGVLEAAEVLT